MVTDSKRINEVPWCNTCGWPLKGNRCVNPKCGKR